METTNAEVVVESGRIVLMPILRRDDSPLGDFCLQIPVPVGTLHIGTKADQCPGKTKKRRIVEIRIATRREDLSGYNVVAGVLVTSPILFIGDATFMFVERRKSRAYERAVQAAQSDSKMAGSFRTDDGQVGACVRIGNKEQSFTSTVSAANDKVVVTLTARSAATC